MAYAWVIDKDHLAEEQLQTGGKVDDYAVGIVGPSAAPDRMVERLHGMDPGEPGWETFTFELYDDDNILYYTGRMITDEGPSEPACAGPLSDFGLGYAGCTSVRYPGHPDMDCS